MHRPPHAVASADSRGWTADLWRSESSNKSLASMHMQPHVQFNKPARNRYFTRACAFLSMLDTYI